MKPYECLGQRRLRPHAELFEAEMTLDAEQLNLQEKKTAWRRDFYEADPQGYMPARYSTGARS